MSESSRREFIRAFGPGTLGLALGKPGMVSKKAPAITRSSFKGGRPNILVAISDDHSWPHTRAYGCTQVDTPAFDRVAEEGVLFQNFFCAAPQCSPNRASILTGRHIGQLEEAGTHASNFPKKFQVYTDLLEESGYEVGFTGKGWGPGEWKFSGRDRNPAGIEYNQIKLGKPPSKAIRDLDYAANFKSFLDRRHSSRPFCFWYGSSEPHRVYKAGSGLEAGKRLQDVEVPPFLPDAPEIRSDILDYFLEIEWFDLHLGQILAHLEEVGELDNTIVVVTGDNGMPFPGAKANLFEYGTHVPLAIRWPERIPAGTQVNQLVSSVDLAPTFLEAAGIESPDQIWGSSMLDLFGSHQKSRDFILSGRERHSHSRPDNLGYPSRAIRTTRHLWIQNFHPERWPMGDPAGSGEPYGFHDIDDSPTKSFLLANKDRPDYQAYYRMAFEKRPRTELYDLRKDPGCLDNLVGRQEFSSVEQRLSSQLEEILRRQNDPRAFGYQIFESYPRYNRMRAFPGFKEQGRYNFAYH